jgi:hypothetical protein
MTWYREAIHGLSVHVVVEFDSGSCSVFYLLGKNKKGREKKKEEWLEDFFPKVGQALLAVLHGILAAIRYN